MDQFVLVFNCFAVVNETRERVKKTGHKSGTGVLLTGTKIYSVIGKPPNSHNEKPGLNVTQPVS